MKQVKQNKQIDVIFPAYINATIGPCGTLRRLIKNKDYISRRGYDLNVFTLDNVIRKDDSTNIPVDFSKGLRFRSRIKSLLMKTVIGYAIMHKHNLSLSHKIVDYYISLNRNADIVIFHETNTCMTYQPYKKKGQKIVCFFHNDGTRWGMILKAHPFLTNSWWQKKQDKVYDDLIQKIDRYVFISQLGQQNFLSENKSIKKEQTSFFHNGIEEIALIDAKDITKKKYRMCSVGTLSHRKGQYLIVEALSRLPKELLAQISLTLYGIGPDYEYLQDMIKAYDLQKIVTLYGNLMNSDIHSELSKHNIFVLMSNNEGLPISIIEAMRAGLPVISTKVSGIPEEVDERNGVLINPKVGELIEILQNIDKYNWDEMGRNSRKRFEEEFTFNSMLKGYCDMLDSTIY